MKKPIEILLAEDNPADIKLTMVALQKTDLANCIQVVKDGEEAVAYLRREAPYASANRPDLILLDLNLPKKSGHEVLAEIKADHLLRAIPVVILTASDDEQDIVKTYNSHANCYITKPLELQRFIEVVQAIDNFWFTIVKLPKGSAL